MTALGVALVNARGDRTVGAVAGTAGVSRPYLVKLEGGRIATPSPHLLRRLAAALGVPYLDVMRAAGYLTDDDTRQATHTPPHGPACDTMLDALRRIWLGEPPTREETTAHGASGAKADGQAVAFGALRRIDPAFNGRSTWGGGEAREEFRRWYLGERTRR